MLAAAALVAVAVVDAAVPNKQTDKMEKTSIIELILKFTSTFPVLESLIGWMMNNKWAERVAWMK